MPFPKTRNGALRLTLAAALLSLGACKIERNPPPPGVPAPALLRGLRTSIHHVHDLDAAKRWYTEVLGRQPYFDEPFYVGFNIGGYELGLSPDTVEAPPGVGGTIAYWAVANADSAVNVFIARGASVRSPVQDVGGGVLVAIVADPFGNLLGLIEGAPTPDR